MAAPQYFFPAQPASIACDNGKNIAMPATIAASAKQRCAVAARRIRALCFFRAWNFFWQLRIAHLISVKVHNGDPHPMLHFAGAKVVQERSPVFVLFEIFGDVFLRGEYVPHRRNP